MRRFIHLAMALSLGLAASMVSHGSLLTIGDASFYVSPLSLVTLPNNLQSLSNASSVGDFIPVTVLETMNTTTDVTDTLSSYLEKDDVFNEAFLQGLSVPFSSFLFLSQSADHDDSNLYQNFGV